MTWLRTTVVGLATLLCLIVAAATAAGTAGAHGYEFAPYVDMTGYPAPDLTAIKRASHARQMSLGFVIAQGPLMCAPTWSGYAADPASGPAAYDRSVIGAFRHAGGNPVPSFGGEAGTELAQACPTVASLTEAYAGVVAAYRPSRLDFDLEGAALGDAAAITRRSEAIAALQRAASAAHRRLRVSFTLPVLPTGLPASSLEVVRNAIAHDVKIAYVNVMTMDYGDAAAPNPRGRMAAYAIKAAINVAHQLHWLYPRLALRGLNRLIGLTPMIGVNDTSSEVFTPADARLLASYARADGIGMLSMWQLARDRQCATRTRYAQTYCSSVLQHPYEFARFLAPPGL